MKPCLIGSSTSRLSFKLELMVGVEAIGVLACWETEPKVEDLLRLEASNEETLVSGVNPFCVQEFNDLMIPTMEFKAMIFKAYSTGYNALSVIADCEDNLEMDKSGS
ncbi:hypothetical protein WICPIJ_005883 [Wickerhamomyces pijperi]|uniref:Uncharacterized protein n=1 Tax=Wickerhamomyces pijperi TaxID=599730 RepID=A0A9P8Q526_WICPI|nr:hypothetical protein WICPIJ_005883 [Wickerhamomyces pijperi]